MKIVIALLKAKSAQAMKDHADWDKATPPGSKKPEFIKSRQAGLKKLRMEFDKAIQILLNNQKDPLSFSAIRKEIHTCTTKAQLEIIVNKVTAYKGSHKHLMQLIDQHNAKNHRFNKIKKVGGGGK